MEEIDTTSFEDVITLMSQQSNQLSLITYYDLLRQKQTRFTNLKGESVKRKMGPIEANIIVKHSTLETKQALASIFSQQTPIFSHNFNKVLEAFILNSTVKDYEKVSEVKDRHLFNIIELWSDKNLNEKTEVLAHIVKHNNVSHEVLFEKVIKNYYLTHVLSKMEEVLGDSILNYPNVTQHPHVIRKNNLAYLVARGLEIKEATMLKYISSRAVGQLKIVLPFCEFTPKVFEEIKKLAEKDSEIKASLIEIEKYFLDNQFKNSTPSSKKIKI
jgi:hypothetical protein